MQLPRPDADPAARNDADERSGHHVEDIAEAGTASRRGLLHGLTAGGVMGVGVAGAALIAGLRESESAAAASGHRRKHKHKHRHRHHKRKHKPTATPTPLPTQAPSLAPTPTPTSTVTSVGPTSTASPRPVAAPALLDDPFSRHLASRFSYGVTPELSIDIQDAGGGLAWFMQQLDPTSPDYPTDDEADATLSWWPSLQRGPLDLWQREKSGTERGWQVMQDFQRWQLMRQMLTRRSVVELMADFWENHLNVPVLGDSIYTWRFDYAQTVRRLSLGRFDDLLTAAITHPAMLLYLNGSTSTKAHPNENLGRELLELHTVGRSAYSEDDVKGSARILTGWHVDSGLTWAASYRTADHYTGQVDVLDFHDANPSADGRSLTRSYLSYLAHHPATARRIARKLAIRFVRDDPSDALVDSLAAVYLASDTDIRPVLVALVSSEEFAASAGLKVRLPAEDVVASYRALGTTVSPPTVPVSDRHVGNAVLWQCSALGVLPHSWPQPNGAPLDGSSWSSPSRMMGSLGLHWVLACGSWPIEGVTYRAPSDWLPSAAVRLDALVEHLCQQLFTTHASQQLIDACCQAVGFPPTELLTADHTLVRWNFARLLCTLLDSPSHMIR